MIIVMRAGASEEQISLIESRLEELGYQVNPIYGVERTVIGAVGGLEHEKVDAVDQLRAYDFVDDVMIITKPYKFVARESRPGHRTVIDLGSCKVGGDEVAILKFFEFSLAGCDQRREDALIKLCTQIPE